ncbi:MULTISPECIES: ABC transporter ATP-binding protein [unclassified Moraxella]|uniref:ABC transporter ATP-binding protein n=1 Tax=unclassified Moraxella TaxID=2685852 RepID=UPI002B4094A1|nr:MULTISPECIES: ABC transporter ATP-binding protein [unclassified Moraxella]
MTLTVNNLSLQFGNKTIFSDVNFHLEQGQIACLLGHSGCGKTSILRCLLGFETPKTGQIVLNDRTLFDESIYIAAHKRNIGMVFQDYALFPHLTVAQNIAFGLTNINKADQRQRVSELLELIEMTGFESRYPHQLSGGQQQRVALARCLAPKPSLILLDEPFSNLDVDLRISLSHQVKELLKSQNVISILVTHDQNEAFCMADMVGIMSDGKLQGWDTPTNLYYRPANEQIAKFIGNGVIVTLDDYAQHCQSIATNPNGKKLLIRPTQTSFCSHTAQGALQATITDKSFIAGDWLYRLSHVQNQKTTFFLIQTQGPMATHQVGDEVHFVINEGTVV